MTFSTELKDITKFAKMNAVLAVNAYGTKQITLTDII